MVDVNNLIDKVKELNNSLGARERIITALQAKVDAAASFSLDIERLKAKLAKQETYIVILKGVINNNDELRKNNIIIKLQDQVLARDYEIELLKKRLSTVEG